MDIDVLRTITYAGSVLAFSIYSVERENSNETT